MANFSALLKGEIARLARKEVKTFIEPLRKANAAQRQQLVALKREVMELRRAVRTKQTKVMADVDAATTTLSRFSAKGLKSSRAKLGLSAGDFGKLIGASGQSVYNWEVGKSVPRASQREKLAALRGIGKREAQRRLEAI